MSETIIGLDAGTTGVTAILFDRELLPLERSYREFAQGFPRPGWVEHEGRAILAAVDQVLGEILARPAASDVLGIGVTNQRETVFACDRSSGEALRPGIVWQDRRTSERCRELRAAGHAPDVRRTTGLVLDPYFSATKIEWMLADDPDLARRAQAGEVVFLTVDALVTRHLNGGTVLATDPTNASRTMLFDIDRKQWSPRMCALFGVQARWLPEVRSSTGDFGSTLPERTAGRSLALRGVVGDQQSALFGQGCFEAGSFKTTFGTGSFLVLNTGSERVDSQRGLLTTLAVGRDGKPCYAVEGSVFVSGALIQWLRDELGFFADAAEVEALAREVEDSDGVIVVPAFAGLGAPYWDAQARGAMFGLTRGTTRAHIARAALEAMALQNAEVIEVLREESGLAIDRMLADGGATANDLLMQMQADLAGVRVERPASIEATARGAAAVCGLGLGLWSDPGTPAGTRQARDTFEAALSEEQRAIRLAEWRDAVGRIRSDESQDR